MNLLAKSAHWYVPAFLKQKELRKLADITAESFGAAAPLTSGMPFEGSLAEYARCTARMVAAIPGGEDRRETIRKRLFERAEQLGAGYRRQFRVSTTEEAWEVARLLYRLIGIDLRHSGGGMITIGRCFFSTYYSASTCGVISALDAGLLSGLVGGGTLAFSQRLTEGCDSCRARFSQLSHKEPAI